MKTLENFGIKPRRTQSRGEAAINCGGEDDYRHSGLVDSKKGSSNCRCEESMFMPAEIDDAIKTLTNWSSVDCCPPSKGPDSPGPSPYEGCERLCRRMDHRTHTRHPNLQTMERVDAPRLSRWNGTYITAMTTFGFEGRARANR